MDELRKNERFSNYGRVECAAICAFSGNLCDVSETGLRATFDALVSLDLEDEYELILRLPQKNLLEIRLLAIPVWRFDDSLRGQTQIGFSVLRALDFPLFSDYLNELKNSSCDFVAFSKKDFSEDLDFCENSDFLESKCQMI